ncbi:hypothetical protein [Actinoplanes aureus]|jgi:hypothetical protein|uniref:Uncharacterized protein n=1 Tax=Actinoplanes aureus TaxID=2792083 RepID=A0A931CHS9_9ACTN|nr:hypothetical protein [Actinoplanes aureus]MBG0566403.1 hypothetical protein [Actinoplanes aureus]
MADTAEVTAIDDDSEKPQDGAADASPAPAPRKSLNSNWALTVAGGLFGTYYLVSGALLLRDKHGNGVFALLMTGIVLVVGLIAVLLFRSYRAERAARK